MQGRSDAAYAWTVPLPWQTILIFFAGKGLVTNYGQGGLQNGRGGGASEVLPLRKGGRRKKFSHSEREGPQKVWGSFYAVVLAILKGGA